MHIKKQYNKICMFSLLFTCFLILTGFTFETAQNELNSAENLISEKKYLQAKEILDSLLINLKAVNESSSETEKMARDLLTPQVYYRLGEIEYQQQKYEEAETYFNNVINFKERSFWDIQAIYYSGMADFNLKRYSDARGNFTRLLNEYKDSKEASKGLYYMGIILGKNWTKN